MNHAKIRVREEDLLKLVLDFLTSRSFNVSMRTLEKESGVVNSPYTDDILFLRELILDGDWEEVLLFAQPFEGLEQFDSKQFKYLILKQKFLELLSLKSHIVGKQAANSIEDVMKTLNLLEESCPSKEEYSNLCWLLTVPNLNERSEFKDWTLDNSRLKCFIAVLDVVGKVLTLERKSKQQHGHTSSKDRLLQLIVKGLFYETCIEFCQSKATGNNFTDDSALSVRTNVLQGIADDYSANLLSWVRSLSDDMFTQPFEQVSIEIVLEKLSRQEKNIRHSVDIPKKIRRNDEENVVFRSLTSLDPAIVNKRTMKSKSMQPSPLTLNHSPAIESDKKLASPFGYSEKDSADYKSHFDEEIKVEKPITNRKTDYKDKLSEGSDRAPDARNTATMEDISTVPHRKPLQLKIQNETENDFHDLQPVQSTDETNKFVNDDGISRVGLMSPKAQSPKQSVEDDLHEAEEKQRRESVMRKLEEYESRKRLMQQQLEEMSRGLNGSASSRSEHGNSSPRQKVIEAGTPGRQYIKAKDLMTNYDTTTSDKVSENGDYGILPSNTKSGNMKQASGEIKHMVGDTTRESDSTPEKHMSDVGGAGPDHFHEGAIEVSHSSGRKDEMSLPTDRKGKVTPRSIGHVVNLADGSGKMNTSTPKRTKRNNTETPPPEASPVQPSDKYRATPKAIPHRALKKETVPGYSIKERKLRRMKSDDQEPTSEEKRAEVLNEGKENKTPKDEHNERKGPMINGVRREVKSPYKQSSSVEEQDVKPGEHENFAAKSTKTKTDDVVSKPIESKPSDNKPLAKQTDNNTPTIKGPGPKIKTRDGSKVLVTELLKSREEIKNATASNQRHESPEREERIEIPRNKHDIEVRGTDVRLSFLPVCMLEDSQAIRAVCFHPDGKLFAIGSNSKILRVCTATNYHPVIAQESEGIPQPAIVFKRNKYHKGSIYCMAWNPLGDIIATGSNDKSIKLLHFDPDNYVQEGIESELNIHNGTVRELSFVPDKPAILISGGAGDGGVQVTDCGTAQTIGTLRGHSGNVMAVYAGEGDLVATGSTDNTLRLWDLRSHRCIDVVMVGDSSPASAALSSNGSYLASGQEDGCILLYDISAGRTLQSFRLHQEDCRSVRFSPDSRYLLTGSYDTDISVLHAEGDLELAVPQHYKIAGHKDKVIQCRWHPHRYAFLSTSADRTAVLWSTGHDRNLMFS